MPQQHAISKARSAYQKGSDTTQRLRFFTFGITLLLVVSRHVWLPWIGGFLIVADPVQVSDAIVPLAGDRERIDYAARLTEKNDASWFVITDMWIDASRPPRTYALSAQEQAVRQGVHRSHIVVAPGMPASTYSEALILKQLATEQQWHSLTIVTSPFHTRRSRMILQDVFRDTGITVSVQPVQHSWYEPTDWWKSDEGARVTWQEYIKIVLYMVGYR